MQSLQSINENKLVVLNSKDSVKLNGEYLSQVQFNFRDLLKNEADILWVGITLLSAEIPISFYNVHAYNQDLTYEVNGISYTLTIPEANYSTSTFITAFTSLFNAGGHGESLAISISRATGQLTFTKSGTYDVVFQPSSMYEVLGLLTDTVYTISTTLTSPHQMNLLGIKKLKVTSPSLSLENYDSHSGSAAHLLHVISVTEGPYALQAYENNHLALMHVKNRSINSLMIEIRDEDHNLVDFNNGYWCMTLCLSITRKFIPPAPDSFRLDDLAISTQNQILDSMSIPTKKELKTIISKIDREALDELEFLIK